MTRTTDLDTLAHDFVTHVQLCCSMLRNCKAEEESSQHDSMRKRYSKSGGFRRLASASETCIVSGLLQKIVLAQPYAMSAEPTKPQDTTLCKSGDVDPWRHYLQRVRFAQIASHDEHISFASFERLYV